MLQRLVALPSVLRSSVRVGLPAALAMLALLAAATARADDRAPFDLRYGMYWGGLHVADVALRYQPNGTVYRSDFRIQTVGMAEMLLRYRGEASSEGQLTSEGRLNGADRLLPEAYRFNGRSRKATTMAEVLFDPHTGAAVHVESRKRGKSRGTDVPQELWVDVLDPLTAFLHLRQELSALRSGELQQVVLPVFDGRRRYDLVAEPGARESLSAAGRDWDALHIDLTVRPVAGFDEEDWEEAGHGTGGMRLEALVSDDARMIPLRIKTRNAAVNVVFHLRQDCFGYEPCAAAAG